MIIKKNIPLKNLNTFGIDVNAKYFGEFHSSKELQNILKENWCKKEKLLILGGGSNILFTQNFNGLVLLNNIKGIEVIQENNKSILVSVGSGEVWHDFVLWSIERNLSGIENLALIPGTVGASPMQNIGAYGMEVKDVVECVEYFDLQSYACRIIKNEECEFSYRDSIFKNNLRKKVVITKVIYRLSKIALNRISYGSIRKELENMKRKPSPKNIAKAVINIRTRKLPNPKTLANSGSFFKNPIIRKEQLEGLKQKFPDIVFYEIDVDYVKVPAGWLIDKAGWKGKKIGNAQCHEKQALVLVNLGSATGQEIYDLSEAIYQSVLNIYGIELEREVNIL